MSADTGVPIPGPGGIQPAGSVEGEVAGIGLNSIADYLEAQKATFEPLLVKGADHFIASVAGTVDQVLPNHGLIGWFTGALRGAIDNEAGVLETAVNTDADGAYELIVTALRGGANKALGK